MRKFLLSLALAFSVAAAHAAGVQWSNIVGGFPTWYGSPTFSSNAYTLSAPLPTSPPWSLVTQQTLRIVIPSGGTNTGAATLNAASTGALPIVTNTESGLSALVGGELVAGLEYDLTYSTVNGGTLAACNGSCYVLSWLAQSPVLAGTSQTVTAAQWASVTVFSVTTASQTLTLPASSGLSPNGAVFIQTPVAVTLAPTGTDTINGVNASLVIPAGLNVLATTDGAGHFYAPLGVVPTPVTIGWVAGVNPTLAPIAVINTASTISAIVGNVETAVGTAATVSVYEAPSGTACGSGTILHSGSFNANGTAATNQTLTVTTSAIPAGDRLCIVTTGGANWTSGSGIGGITVYLSPS